MGSHWRRELAEFRAFRSDRTGSTYVDWQPAKWQSLSRIADLLVDKYLAGDARSAPTALELGCGSATLLIQLAMRGVEALGVDRDENALRLAAESAASLSAGQAARFRAGDFTDAATVDGLGPADLVLHIGVIEHFDVPAQLDFLRLSARLSRRWVLVGIPNVESPVFRSFLRTMQRRDAVYDDDHLSIDVPSLADELGYRVESADGCHLFLGRQEFYNPGDAELDEFYVRMRDLLVSAGGDRYDRFPRLDFDSADIAIMRDVEAARPVSERQRFGFLNYYLIDCSA